jgi:RNA polymerase sigma-70 factor (ECF subfamily)
MTVENESDYGGSRFESTHWSLVLAAGHHSSPDANQALSTLCRTYWYPLYAYVRRRVKDVHEAEDLTQAFFAQLLEKKRLAVAEAGRGKFRSFLLASLKNFLDNEWDKARTQKRGGGRKLIPLDFQSGESRYKLEPADELTPERLYDRQWALTLLEQVLARLREEFVRAGKARHFEQLKHFLTGEKAPTSYAQAADELGSTEGAVKVSVHRLRQRYRELLRVEIAQTVAEPGEVEDEINRLFAVLGS